MLIQGLQKLTLLDYPEKVACTVFTAGCNFRCPFCHNASLVIDTYKNEEIPVDTLYQFLKKRQGVLDGVCVTGGEPLIQHDIEEFLRGIKELGYAIKLDTNGSCPKKLKEVVRSGLVDYVAMDIKNSRESYAKTIGIEGYNIENVEKCVQFLLEITVPFEVRTTVVREFHRRADFEAIAEWIKGAKRYYLQQFVDSGDLIGTGLHGYNKEIMEQALKIFENRVEIAELRGVS